MEVGGQDARILKLSLLSELHGIFEEIELLEINPLCPIPNFGKELSIKVSL